MRINLQSKMAFPGHISHSLRWSARLGRAFVLISILSSAGAVHGQSSADAVVDRVAQIGMTVRDLDRSVRFFEDALTFSETSRREEEAGGHLKAQGLADSRLQIATLRLGDETVELTQFIGPVGRPYPEDSRSNDRWFQHIAIIVSDMDRAYAHLEKMNVRHASSRPQRLPDWNKNAAGIKAFYFRDPDGHFLEILEFPPGKGDPKWHRKSDRLFLGIDHTAIVVKDTERSLAFYRDRLGMRVVGSSENYGKEQEALNHVPGAHLRITTLRASAGPGIEFLEYLEPRDGRDYPSDARANDLIHWQTTLVCKDVGSAAVRLKRPDANGESSGTRESFLLRDPDGHAMIFTQN